MITIYEKMWFAVNKSRANSLAYITYYEDNKAFEKRKQTDLIDYLTLKVVACGFIKSYAVTPKIGFFSYMMPCWVHKMHLMFKCVFNPELVGGLYIIMEQLGYNKQ